MSLLSKRLAFAFASASLLCAVPVFAQESAPPSASSQTDAPPPQEGGGPHRGGPEHRVEMLQHMLNLSADQTTQAKAIFAAERTKMEALRSNNALSQDDRRTQMMAIHHESDASLRALLTPDQVTKYDAMEARMRERRQNGGGPDGPGGPPPSSQPQN